MSVYIHDKMCMCRFLLVREVSFVALYKMVYRKIKNDTGVAEWNDGEINQT